MKPDDDAVEKALEDGRVETTPDLDARELAKAGAELPRRPRWKVWAAAAMVLVTGSLLAVGFAGGGGGDGGPGTVVSSRPAQVGADSPPAVPVGGAASGPVTKDARPGDRYDLGGGGGGGGATIVGLELGEPKPAAKPRAEFVAALESGNRVSLPKRRALLYEADEVHSTEEYDAVEEGGFLDPRRTPLSTFSIDVDTASMSNVRRILGEGRLPPAAAQFI